MNTFCGDQQALVCVFPHCVLDFTVFHGRDTCRDRISPHRPQRYTFHSSLFGQQTALYHCKARVWQSRGRGLLNKLCDCDWKCRFSVLDSTQINYTKWKKRFNTRNSIYNTIQLMPLPYHIPNILFGDHCFRLCACPLVALYSLLLFMERL